MVNWKKVAKAYSAVKKGVADRVEKENFKVYSLKNDKDIRIDIREE